MTCDGSQCQIGLLSLATTGARRSGWTRFNRWNCRDNQRKDPRKRRVKAQSFELVGRSRRVGEKDHSVDLPQMRARTTSDGDETRRIRGLRGPSATTNSCLVRLALCSRPTCRRFVRYRYHCHYRWHPSLASRCPMQSRRPIGCRRLPSSRRSWCCPKSRPCRRFQKSLWS